MKKPDRFIKKLRARQESIAKVRDKLRQDIMDAEGLVDDCDEAFDDLHRAIDALSRLQ